MYLWQFMFPRSRYIYGGKSAKQWYLEVYKRFIGILEEKNLWIYEHWDAFEDESQDPPYFLEFWSIWYPKRKLKSIFGKENKEKLLEQLTIRLPLSLHEWHRFCRKNIWVGLVLKLFIVLNKHTLKSESVRIIKSMLDKI